MFVFDKEKLVEDIERTPGLTLFQFARIKEYIDEFKDRVDQISRQGPEHIQTMMMHNWFPASTNTLLDATHFERKRIKDDDLAAVNASLLEQGLRKVDPECPVRRRVCISLFLGEKGKRRRGRRMDTDNACKSLYDALKRAGLIYEDNNKWCKQEMPEQIEGPFPELGGHGTVLTIEDLI